MAAVNPASLVGKLNPTCLRALQGAAGLCLSRTNYNVELEHWLTKLLEAPNTDLTRILRHYDVDPGRVNRELTKAIDSLKTGNARAPELSLDVTDAMREAWVFASLTAGVYKIRSGHLLTALLSDRTLSGRLRSVSAELSKIAAEKITAEVLTLIKGSSEDAGEVASGEPRAEGGSAAGSGASPDSKTPALDQFTMNLTESARQGKIDPVIGRDFEIRQVIDILLRRRQNNPILTGEAGVGKTAVVEGFALRIVSGDVPPPLRNVALRTLDLGLLQAGAGVKGEFENRLKSVIAEVKSSSQPIVLFIDEAHTLIGAGGSAGSGDAANLLKPALARGELRTVAATTWDEYKKFFEKDPALKRRFQLVKVDEPDEARAVLMMRGVTLTMEKHHKVRILDEAIEDAVKLSARYIPDRQLPDKSVSLLDTACSRIALGQSATPPVLEDCRREIEHLTTEIGVVQRELSAGAPHESRLQEITERRAKAQERLGLLEKRWTEERKIVEELQKIRTKLETSGSGDGKDKLAPEDEGRTRAELQRLQTELIQLQGESPLVQPVVDRQAIAAVVSAWTGIPIGKMVTDEIKTLLALKDRMEERVVGQGHALEAIAQRIRTGRAGLTDPKRPIGVFLLVGPSGVGKTETAMTLADILYGGERNMVIVNMSEYKESHQVSNLVGASKGLVGAEEGGILTEAVRRKPYSVVLLDEVEKAHVDVQELFYQVFDKGVLQDANGTEVDFKNTIILLTSNAGTDTIMKVCADPDTMPDAVGLGEALRPDLLKSFKPALLGRMTVVPYFPLSDEVVRSIIKLNLKKIANRLRESHKATFTYDEAVVATVAGRCKEVESGARNVDHILTGSLLPEMSREVLSRMAEGRGVASVHVGVDGEGKFTYRIE